jgi:hypothetical protein
MMIGNIGHLVGPTDVPDGRRFGATSDRTGIAGGRHRSYHGRVRAHDAGEGKNVDGSSRSVQRRYFS